MIREIENNAMKLKLLLTHVMEDQQHKHFDI